MIRNKKSIMEMAHGAFLERMDYEMSKVFDNIIDPNTKATAKRKIISTITLTPTDDRDLVSAVFEVKSSLVATNPVVTSLYITAEEATGEVCAVEMAPQLPGQMGFDGQEQENPAQLRLIRNA